MKRFIIFTDSRYAELCKVLLDSLARFSQATVKVVAIDCDFWHAHPRLEIDRVDKIEPEKIPIYRLEYLAQLTGPWIMLDADTVANWNIDSLFKACDRTLRTLQQPAPCGSLDEKLKTLLTPPERFVFCNTVPLVLGQGGAAWLKACQSDIAKWNAIYKSLHGNEVISDEMVLNCLRCLSHDTAYLSIVEVDRKLFKSYLEGWESLQETLKQEPHYLNRKFSWHCFHGERNPDIARWMFDELRERGPEFITTETFRDRSFTVYG